MSNFKPFAHCRLLSAVTAFLLSATLSPAAIIMVNTGSSFLADNSGTVMETTAQTLSFNAGATADAIIVSLSSESNASAGQVSISYAGFTLTPVIDHVSSNVSIWYLNLSGTTYVSGSANLVLNMSDVGTVNGYGLGVVSVNAGGMDIGAHVSNTSTTQNISLTTTLDSFVIAGHYANSSSGSASASSPLTALYGAQIGSAQGGAGYRASVAPGNLSYSFTSAASVSYNTSAVAFAVVPEPTSAVLVSFACVMLILRRRRS